MSRLKQIRSEKNLTGYPLIDLLGISPCNYYKKEMGQIRFSLLEAKKIADYFNMSIEEIFFADDYSKIE